VCLSKKYGLASGVMWGLNVCDFNAHSDVEKLVNSFVTNIAKSASPGL